MNYLVSNPHAILMIKLAMIGVVFLISTLIPGILLFKKFNFKDKKNIIGIIFLILSFLSFIEIFIVTIILM